jgi:hypothetical protein
MPRLSQWNGSAFVDIGEQNFPVKSFGTVAAPVAGTTSTTAVMAGLGQIVDTAGVTNGSMTVTDANAVASWLNCTVTGASFTAGTTITAVSPGVGYTTSNNWTGSTGNVSLTVYAGITFTPKVTGKVLVRLASTAGTATTVATTSVRGQYGTGASPINGAAGTGTAFPQGTLTVRSQVAAAGTYAFFEVIGTLTGLVVGTAYWFDVEFFTSAGADQSNLGTFTYVIEECS